METHVFNEQTKRFDPIDNRCACCGKSLSQGENDNFYISLYKENDRTNLIVYRNVKFSRIDIGVTRCEDCKTIQRQVMVLSVILGILAGIATAAVLFIIAQLIDMDVLSVIIIFVGLILGVAIGILTGKHTNRTMCLKHGILSKEDAAQKYDIVNALLNDGWTFEQPSA